MIIVLFVVFVVILYVLLGDDGWCIDDSVLQVYVQDNLWWYVLLVGVVFLCDCDQVVVLVCVCCVYGIVLVVCGVGIGIIGVVVLVNGSIVFLFVCMNCIFDIQLGNCCVVVELGVFNGDLQYVLVLYGLFWVLDLFSVEICSIGGNFVCNVGGLCVVKYGISCDNVFGLVVVIGVGEVIWCGGVYIKDVIGYDLIYLLVGSEGMLVLIVEVMFKLILLFVVQVGLCVLYCDVNVVVVVVLCLMVQLVVFICLEFMDVCSLELLCCNGVVVFEVGVMLLVEVDGDYDILFYLLQVLVIVVEGDGLIVLDVVMEGSVCEMFWVVCKVLLLVLCSIVLGKINEDVVVLVLCIFDLVVGVQVLVQEYVLIIVIFGYVGNGNLYVNILYYFDDVDENVCVYVVLLKIFVLIFVLGGMLFGEYGIGLVKCDFMVQVFMFVMLVVMWVIKWVLDLDGFFNFGKVLLLVQQGIVVV